MIRDSGMFSSACVEKPFGLGQPNVFHRGVEHFPPVDHRHDDRGVRGQGLSKDVGYYLGAVAIG